MVHPVVQHRPGSLGLRSGFEPPDLDPAGRGSCINSPAGRGPGPTRATPLWTLFLIKLSLSLNACHRVALDFPPVLIRPALRLLIGPSNACPRAAPETTPLWRLFLIKLSLSLSLSLSRGYALSSPGTEIILYMISL